jgi:hypothetical protein
VCIYIYTPFSCKANVANEVRLAISQCLSNRSKCVVVTLSYWRARYRGAFCATLGSTTDQVLMANLGGDVMPRAYNASPLKREEEEEENDALTWIPSNRKTHLADEWLKQHAQGVRTCQGYKPDERAQYVHAPDSQGPQYVVIYIYIYIYCDNTPLPAHRPCQSSR